MIAVVGRERKEKNPANTKREKPILLETLNRVTVHVKLSQAWANWNGKRKTDYG